jgi:hypothetical protein
MLRGEDQMHSMSNQSERNQVIVDLLSAGASMITSSELDAKFIVFDCTNIPQDKKQQLAWKYPGMFPSKYVAWPARLGGDKV